MAGCLLTDNTEVDPIRLAGWSGHNQHRVTAEVILDATILPATFGSTAVRCDTVIVVFKLRHDCVRGWEPEYGTLSDHPTLETYP